MSKQPLQIDVVTLFPEMVQTLGQYGVIGRALDRGLVRLSTWNPRDYTHDRHRTVDDRPYGGGPGMLMKVDPLRQAIRAARDSAAATPEETGQDGQNSQNRETRVIYLTPQGRKLDQELIRQSADKHLVLIAGRYEGVDERLIDMEVDEEWSIGDYVLSGGELAAMVVIDAVVRMLPGALGDEGSAQQDSFMDGLLDCPHYTRPEVFEGERVPQVLLNGNHQEIERWRLKQSLGRTWLRRPDLLQERQLTVEQQTLLDEFKREHYSREHCPQEHGPVDEEQKQG